MMKIVIHKEKPEIDYKMIENAQAIDLANEIKNFYERNTGAEITSFDWSGDITIIAKRDGVVVEQTVYCLR